ncbi:MAG: deoxyribodipyrimidine photolyase [Methylobacter sp.]|nr:MAG: deoxyribodipyrimidine photolyase [Methylobacter sp.]
MIYQTALFLFRRDLRLEDNTALNAALKSSRQVVLGFVFDPRQIEPHPYQSQSALVFMRQALAELVRQCGQQGHRLVFFDGLPEQVIEDLYAQHAIDAVFANRDYTPFSRRRDAQMVEVCERLNIAFHSYPDALLIEPECALKHDGSVYKVFTAFYNHVKKFPVALPAKLSAGQGLAEVDSKFRIEFDQHSGASSEVGRFAALKVLSHLQAYQDYSTQRDFPAHAYTTGLSAQLKFGTVSVREVYHAIANTLGAQHALLRQLYWRDFFTHIGFYFPRVFGHAFIEKFDALAWDNQLERFQAWSQGKTGFPIVDAGMRELNETGYMHNRVRMITASFLVKDLHISWRWGERYFAQHLTDYDPCINNGNWQWAASTGCDAQPYFRIFNPWLQQQKFDPGGEYLYKWLPEIRSVPVKILHQWHFKHYGEFYPAPIVDHAYETQLTKARYQQAETR